MKFNLKSVLATSLATLMACAPLAALSVSGSAKAYRQIPYPLGNTDIYSGHCYHNASEMVPGNLYVFVAVDEEGNNYALSAQTGFKNGVSAAPIYVVRGPAGSVLSGGRDFDDSLWRGSIWTANEVEEGTYPAVAAGTYLANQDSLYYLGTEYRSMTKMYTWNGLDGNYGHGLSVEYSNGQLIMHINAYQDRYIVFNGSEFVLADEPSGFIHLYEYTINS